jgi:DNA-binding MarR family transcriptional regulator
MPKTIESQQLAAWRAMLTAQAELNERIDRAMRESDAIPLHWYDALSGLAEAPRRRLRLGELARVALLSRSGLSRLVDRLEEAGLLAREACGDDARGAFAVLTPAGLTALRKASRVYGKELQDRFGQHVTAKESAVIAGALQRVLEANDDGR